MARPKKDTITKEVLLDLINDGYKNEEIAEKLNVSKNTIGRRIKEYGLSVNKGRPLGSEDKQKRIVTKPRQYQEPETDFLRPGPRPVDMQFGISDEQVVMRCQSVYDFSESIARLKPEFKNQIGLPKSYKKVYDNGKRY